jgi:hypothetical protein
LFFQLCDFTLVILNGIICLPLLWMPSHRDGINELKIQKL